MGVSPYALHALARHARLARTMTHNLALCCQHGGAARHPAMVPIGFVSMPKRHVEHVLYEDFLGSRLLRLSRNLAGVSPPGKILL